MKMTEVKQKARSMGIRPGKMRKTELIRTVQRQESSPDCFGRSFGNCPRTECCFWSDCIKITS